VVLVYFKARSQKYFGGTEVTTKKLFMGDNWRIFNETTDFLTENNCANNYNTTDGEA
jgi:hypothetical protein